MKVWSIGSVVLLLGVFISVSFAMAVGGKTALAGDIDLPFICEGYEDHQEPFSLQHRYVKRLEKLSCRMRMRINFNPWYIFSKEGRMARKLGKEYRKAIKKLLACTSFTEENTREDRIYACTDQMDGAYRTLFKLSDHLESIPKITTAYTHRVLVHNRRALDIMMSQTKYQRPKRSWYDFGDEI